MPQTTDDLVLAHLRSTLFIVPMSEDISTNTVWPGFHAHQSQHPLASQCLLSLSQVYFGLQQNASDFVKQGMMLYGRSLIQLNSGLSDSGLRKQDDTILSVMILFLYEMLVLNSTDGWVEHALGLGKLIHLRGSEAFDNPGRRTLFESNRFIIILASLVAARPTFLSNPEWKTLPWASQPGSKDDMHALLDILADLATLKSQQLGGWNEWDRLSSEKTALSTAIKELRKWRQQWELANVGDLKMVPNQKNDDGIMPYILNFPTLYKANAFSLYNATYIQAFRLVANANDGHLNAEHTRDLHRSAEEICLATHYQLHTSDPMSGPFLVLFPLQMAALALEDTQSSFKGWIARTLTSFASTKSGWGVARQISAYSKRPNHSVSTVSLHC